MAPRKRSLASASGSTATPDDTASQWRLQRASFYSLVSYFEAVLLAKSKGRADYWNYVLVVKADSDVVLQCKLCGKQLSARNLSDSAGSHISKLPDGTFSCKESKKRRIEVDAHIVASGHYRFAT
jgi:hypothetical protein